MKTQGMPAAPGPARPFRPPRWTAIRFQAGEFSARTVGSFLGEIASRERLRQLDRKLQSLDREIDRILGLSAEPARTAGLRAAGSRTRPVVPS